MSHYLGPISPAEKIEQINTPGFECMDFRQPAHLSIRKHAHPSPIMLFVLGGSLVERYAGRSFEYTATTVVFRPAGEEHEHNYGQAGARCLAVAIQTNPLQQYEELQLLSRGLMHSHDPSMFVTGVNILGKMQCNKPASAVLVEELLYKALAQFCRLQRKEKGATAPAWLSRALDLIHDCFLQELSLSQIANTVGVHPIYLADCFRKYYGDTVAGTIRRLRFKYALAQMSQADDELTKVALDSGFYDHSHFTNFIKKQTGMTPSELRQIMRHK